jgi:hypothetical protein
MPIPLGSRTDISLVSHSSFLFACATRRACEDEYDRKTSFASQDRTDSRFAATDTRPEGQRPEGLYPPAPRADECHAASRQLSCERIANDDVPGCRLPQAVAATHVHTRTISHARTPGTIPSSRCQTTRARSILRPARIVFSWTIIFQPDWWSQSGSNRRPHACKARALPAELWPLNRRQ